MSAEDSLGDRDTACCEVWGGGWGLSCWWNALSAMGLLLTLVLCLVVLMKETSQGVWILCSSLELVCFCSWFISSVRGEVFNSRFFWLFLLFRTICNFHLWTLGLCRNSLYGSEFICIVLLAWLWFSLTVTSAGKRKMELNMKNCFVLQSF